MASICAYCEVEEPPLLPLMIPANMQNNGHGCFVKDHKQFSPGLRKADMFRALTCLIDIHLAPAV